MDENKRRYFHTLARTGNITKAARDLYISRQGLSKSIRLLEDQLGVTLFLRRKDGVVLTDAGQLLLHYIEEDDRLWNLCLTDMAAADEHATECVHVGMLSMYFGYDEKVSLFAIKDEVPNLRIEVVDGDHDAFWRGLVAGELDLAFSVRPPESLGLGCMELIDDRMFVVMGASNPLSTKEEVDFEGDLPGRTILQTSPYKDRVYGPVYRERGIESELIDFDKDLVEARLVMGDELFIVQESYAKHLVNDHTCMRPLVGAPFVMESCVVWRPGLTGMASKVLEYIIEAHERGLAVPYD